MRGWISVQKQIRNHWVWRDPKYFRAWMDMLMMANYSEVKKPYKETIVLIKRGEFPASIRKLGERWGMAPNTVNSFIKRLKADTMIDTHTKYGFTLVKIINYEKYQSQTDTLVDTVTDTLTDTVADTLTDTTIIKDNKINKTNKKKGDAKKASPLPLKERHLKFVEEVKRIGKEQGLPEVEQRKFNNYWGASNQGGKKMRWEMEKVFDMRRRMNTWKMKLESMSWDKNNQVKAPEIQKELKKVKYICFGCDQTKEIQGDLTPEEAFCKCGDQFMKQYEYNTLKAKDGGTQKVSGIRKSQDRIGYDKKGKENMMMTDQEILKKVGLNI